MYIHINEGTGKVDDKCSQLTYGHKGLDVSDEEYIIIPKGSDIRIDDTWDFENNISLKDSFHRIKKKSDLEILQEQFVIIDNILDAVCNIKENPPEIPRLDRIEIKINEIIDWLITQGCESIEKLPE